MILSWVGRLGLWMAFLAVASGAVVSFRVATSRSSRSRIPFAVLAVVGIVLSVVAMQWALVTHDFRLAYVAENNATFTPLLYSITGMWSALEGSLLLWVLLLNVIVLVVVSRYRHQLTDALVAVAQGVLFLVSAFFTLIMAGPADPFLLSPHVSSQGAGPNALLQDNPLVAIHPPLLYLGFVGMAIPFAFSIAMLVTGRLDERWLFEQRRWTLVAWGSLSVGIVLGAWWSYQVLGWGGFWGWDPVENAALLPWLTATAYIHSVIVQERRGLFRVWNLSLAVATFSLTVLGTFFTRSGVLQSVHAFSSSTLGPLLLGGFALSALVGLGLIAWRGDRLRSAVGVDSPFSREGLFVANNVLFVGFAIVVLVGTVFPLLYQAVNGAQVTVGTPYFAAVASPLAGLLLLLMAVAPLVSWRVADVTVLWRRVRFAAWAGLGIVVILLVSGQHRLPLLAATFAAVIAGGAALRTLILNYRAGRTKNAPWWRFLTGPSSGGMVTHLGVVVMALGIVTSTSLTSRHEVALASGRTTVVAGHRVGFFGTVSTHSDLLDQTYLKVIVDGHEVRPAITTYHGTHGNTVGTPAIDSNLLRDVYVTFDAVGGNGTASGAQVQQGLPAGSVVLGVTIEPLLSWLWIGGIMIGLGAAFSFFRGKE